MTGEGAQTGSRGALTRTVLVRFHAGPETRGKVNVFNPQMDGFFLILDSPGSAGMREIQFDQVKTVTFLRQDGPSTAGGFLPTASMVTVRLLDGETLQGVSESYGGTRRGLYLVPTDKPGVTRIYIPLSAVLEVVSVKRLGEILTDEGMLTREQVEAAFHRQTQFRGEKLGEILVRRKVITDRQLQHGLSLQSRETEKRIGEILVDQGFVNQVELEEALDAQRAQKGKKVGEIMVEMGFATFKMIGIALAMQYHVPFVDLAQQAVDGQITQLVPVEFARQWQVIPIGFQDRVLTVAVADPTQVKVKETLRLITGFTVIWAVATPHDIARAIENRYV